MEAFITAVVVLGLAAWIFFALRSVKKNGGHCSGCKGDCANCRHKKKD